MRHLPVTALLIFLFSYTSVAAQENSSAQKQQSTMIVLDGSNSMWGQLEGVNKIVTARESLKTLLENARDNVDFGLLTYGGLNKQKKGCNNFTLVSKPEEYDVVNMMKSVYRMNPRGRSPIAASLKLAASQLPKENAHILLVSDGEESCGGDPCAVAAELVRENPSLQIDVIGFRDEKEAQLECIAENGRGAFVVADNHDRLKTLLGGIQAKALAIKTDNIKTLAPASSKNSLAGSVELAIKAQGRDIEPLRANYSIYTLDNNNVVNFTSRTQVREYLKPGNYRIKAVWKNYDHTETIQVQAGKTSRYQFDAGPVGHIQMASKDKNNRPLNTNYSIYTLDGDFVSQYLVQSQVKTVLPVGQYRVKANLDDQVSEEILTVDLAGVAQHTFEFNRK